MNSYEIASGGPMCYPSYALLENAMDLAIDQARLASKLGETPVGAALLWGEEVIAEAHNLRETRSDPLAHAECLVIAEAARKLKRWRLCEATLVVTLEPCLMCMGAVLQARIPRIVFGASDPKAGAAGTLYDLSDDPRLNHKVQVARGLRAGECAKILQDFFQARKSRL